MARGGFRYWPQIWNPGQVQVIAPSGSVPAPYLGVDAMLSPTRPIAEDMIPGKYELLPQIIFSGGKVQVNN